jgi:predicted lipoprotein with Yx(FWY)xxD motif
VVVRVLAVAGAAALVGACGSSGGGSKVASNANAPGAASGSSGPTVDAASNSKLGDTVLVDGKGLTLYRNARETGTSIVCTGSCATEWPPLLLTGGASAVAGTGVKGTLSSVTRPDGGVQVTFNGMPLYLFSGDKSAGDANGQGVSQIWFAVPATGAAAAASSSQTSTTNATAAVNGGANSTTTTTAKAGVTTTTAKSAAGSSTTAVTAAANNATPSTTAAPAAASTTTTAHAQTTAPPTTSAQTTTSQAGGGGGGNTTSTDYYYP